MQRLKSTFTEISSSASNYLSNLSSATKANKDIRLNKNTYTKVNKASKISRKITINKFNVPLDEHQQPFLLNQLPFLSFNNFTLNSTQVYENSIELNGQDQIDKALLRGVDPNKYFLYKSDKEGFFKCLNSNVI